MYGYFAICVHIRSCMVHQFLILFWTHLLSLRIRSRSQDVLSDLCIKFYTTAFSALLYHLVKQCLDATNKDYPADGAL